MTSVVNAEEVCPFLDRLLGNQVGVLVLTLGASVSDVEVTGVPKGGEFDAT